MKDTLQNFESSKLVIDTKIKDKSIKKFPELWASIARITACTMIFIYHHSGLYEKSLGPLDFFALIIFVFLSGYFSFKNGTSNYKILFAWLIRRIKAIMIPYWQVILLVIFINEFYQYKDTTFLKNMIIMLGGSMFLDNPLYIISWFITLILLLYLFIFAFQISSNKIFKFIIFIVGLSFGILLNKYLYFLAFCAGYTVKQIKEKYFHIAVKARFIRLNEVCFLIQNYCYSFFLIHGGVLLLAIKVLKLSPVSSFIMSFILTSIITVFHYNFSLMLQKKIIFSCENKYKNQRVNND
jgi:hypothetical protein